MWGVNLAANRWKIASAATKLFQYKSTKLYKGLDQNLLDSFIWPLASKNLVRINCNVAASLRLIL